MTQEPSTKSDVAAGTSIVAAVVLVTVGVLQVFQGIAALARDEVFVVGIEYVYKFDLTTWGWIHLILGVVVVLVGVALFTGATWARICAIIVLALSIVANFLWIPYYPWWSLTVIALAVLAIWGLAAWKPDEV
ncbi:MAG TPA: hypothetical protein VIW24_25500 [Aldersonia sp.]